MRRSDAALAPVRRALASDAARAADSVLADATARAEELDAAARGESDAILARAVADGTAAGRAAAALADARARREAHGHVLATAQRLRAETVARTVSAATALRDDPRYPALLEAWTARCRTVLGADAEVRPVPEGGVVGELGSRRLDLRLTTLAERAAEDVLVEEGDPWS
ncbi:hypothetical protein OEB99_04540 [Actinotalea sp. M2MS4P-6]|uniref:hypothetical protein n=1 Tax=Actinotalea sp. M2MS4P-6 TaxID=2983762 RepID=UPI0021E426F7|nr:hypothetical protein [Actinotalea sp. M2MS4P-6]MCV2393568.1 hypothetical protein [Actinotalea sp. M2MS4P-6]